MKTFLRFGVLPIFALACAHAQTLRNGDFSTGRSYWDGSGATVVALDEDQKPVVADTHFNANPDAPKGTPQLEVKLSKTALREIRQRLNGAPSPKRRCKLEVVLKTSPDFARNEKASGFSANNWQPGGTYYWSAIVRPNVDFCLRLDADTHYYLPHSLKPGGDWQTLRGEWEVSGGRQKDLVLVFAAGTGTVWVKSVALSWE